MPAIPGTGFLFGRAQSAAAHVPYTSRASLASALALMQLRAHANDLLQRRYQVLLTHNHLVSPGWRFASGRPWAGGLGNRLVG